MTLSELLATPEYAGLTDEEACELLHQKRHVGEARYTYLGLAKYLDPDTVRRLASTVDAVATSDPLVEKMRLWLEGGGDGMGLDVGDEKTRAMVDAFADDTNLPLTENDAEAIKALAIVVSDADLYGFQRVTAKHIMWDRTGVRKWRR